MTPRIHLAIDNCFAFKRYTQPDDWAQVIASLGLRNVEASADTELDPLYMGVPYLRDWALRVKEAEARHGVRVCNLYSGHGTYTTLGLTHSDERVRERMILDWFFPMIQMAGELGCGMGFFAHAFHHRCLQDRALYEQQVALLIQSLTRLNRHAGQFGCRTLGIEQMYSPHQYPWRIRDAEELLRLVTRESGRDFYFTEDVGHHHVKFMRPTREAVTSAGARGVWLGTDRAFALADAEGAAAWDEISSEVEGNPQLFSTVRDGDCYAWLETLGCYSPILHLQQTDGRTSAHLPFTDEHNRRGRITGEGVLCALQRAYERPDQPGMPTRCEDVYLTLEIFSGTTSIMHDLLADCRTSVEYWRRFVPADGLDLAELTSHLDRGSDLPLDR
jgi:D-erythrulose 1-phosphate 3-epimerase